MTEKSADEPTAENPLSVIIRDASIKDRNISFNISIKTILTQFTMKDTLVTRVHSDFDWLYRTLCENSKYAGIIIPCCPPDPDFTVNRDSIAVYTEEENADSEEFQQMKQELEREYLALFKKTVTFHERFLLRLSRHPILRLDCNYIEFLTSQEQLNSKVSATTYLKGLFNNIKNSIDENIVFPLTGVVDPDRFFEEENHYITNYSSALKKVLTCSDSMTLSQKRQSNLMIKLSIQLSYFASHEYTTLSRIIDPLAAFFDKARKTECRISSDEDLKLSDTFRADFWNSAECKDLLLRRIKNYVAADKSFKALTKAKQTNLNVAIADDQYQQDLNKFDSISESAKSELNRQNSERIDLYNKNLTAYCDLQINHLKTLINETQSIIERLQAED